MEGATGPTWKAHPHHLPGHPPLHVVLPLGRLRRCFPGRLLLDGLPPFERRHGRQSLHGASQCPALVRLWQTLALATQCAAPRHASTPSTQRCSTHAALAILHLHRPPDAFGAATALLLDASHPRGSASWPWSGRGEAHDSLHRGRAQQGCTPVLPEPVVERG